MREEEEVGVCKVCSKERIWVVTERRARRKVRRERKKEGRKRDV